MAKEKKNRKEHRFIDVTKEYYEEATPGRGNIDKEKGYPEKHSKNEIEMAKIIHRELGGDIFLINENLNRRSEISPDYKWNEELWDLKSPVQIRSFTKRIRKGIHQIEKSPGGIIVDLPESIPFNDAVDIIWKRWKTTGEKAATSLDVIFVQNGRIIRILRFK